MRSSLLLASLLACGLNAATAFAQQANQWNTGQSSVAEMPAADKFTFVLFWKEDNGPRHDMAASLQTTVDRQSDRATWTEVDVKDYGNRDTVDRFGVDRAPMPLVLCVAPNGAVTGAFTEPLSEEAVETALVTPAMAECMKALQARKLVVVHVMPDANTQLPIGAGGFIADPDFKPRTTLVSLAANDPAESRFVEKMELDDAMADVSVVLVMAPPNVLVGKFPATATKEQIAAKLHAAGKCCDDPNCKHNKKAR